MGWAGGSGAIIYLEECDEAKQRNIRSGRCGDLGVGLLHTVPVAVHTFWNGVMGSACDLGTLVL